MGHVKDYVRLDLGPPGVPTYVRNGRLEILREVDAIVFDCDGVLIDIRESYNKAIARTASYIFRLMTGCILPESAVSDEVLLSFRKTGGFNNDWDLTYAILLVLTCETPLRVRERLLKHLTAANMIVDPYDRLEIVTENMRQEADHEFDMSASLDELSIALIDYSKKLDETGVSSVDTALNSDDDANNISFYQQLKQFFDFKTSIDSNVVARIFEEFFCGPELFTKSYGMQPRFNKKQQGLIDNEHLIITSETLSLLSAILGSSNLGIASGSGADQANYILGDLLRSFRSEALVFRETVEEAMRGAVEKGGMVSLLKPHPFSLLRTAQALEPFGRILCVGDSMEDAKMVEKALERDDRFSFAAVYSYSAPRDAALESLLEYGCDWVLPSVNELPKLLRAAWRNLT